MENKMLLYSVLITYVISLLLPGIIFQDGTITYGYTILLTGGLGFLVGIFAWYANPLLLLALIRLKKETAKSLFVTAVFAFVLGLSALIVHDIPKNEAGGKEFIDHLGIGYYVWMVSLGIFVVYTYRRWRGEFKRVS
jgi:hypothetical protein